MKTNSAEYETLELMDILEGHETTSYLCTAKKITIGYGFNMDSSVARNIWIRLNISEDFDNVYNKKEEITQSTASILFNDFWIRCEDKAKDRCDELKISYKELPQYHKFILCDIVYNTGSCKNWKKVFLETEPKKVLLEARRKQHELDSRIAKIGKYFNIIDTIDEAIEIGLTETRYIV